MPELLSIGPALRYLTDRYLRPRLTTRLRGDSGMSEVLALAVIAGIAVIAALTVGGILFARAQSKANDVDLDNPPPVAPAEP